MRGHRTNARLAKEDVVGLRSMTRHCEAVGRRPWQSMTPFLHGSPRRFAPRDDAGLCTVTTCKLCKRVGPGSYALQLDGAFRFFLPYLLSDSFDLLVGHAKLGLQLFEVQTLFLSDHAVG